VTLQADVGPDDNTRTRIFQTIRTARVRCNPSGLSYLNQVPLRPGVYLPADSTLPTETLIHYETRFKQKVPRNDR